MNTLIKGIKYLFLGPFSLLIQLIYKVRRSLYYYRFFKSYKFSVPIISIGNITFGGTGKSPLTLWIANYFADLDKCPMILTRGHKGRLENGCGVIAAGKSHLVSADVYGDEPVMMASRMLSGSVVVGKNRAVNLKNNFVNESPDIVLLDDGHQHLKIFRNLNIVLFDTLVPIEKYKVALLGILREGIAALKDADIIILGHSELSTAEQRMKLLDFLNPYFVKNALVIETSYQSSGAFNGLNRKLYELHELKGKNVVALSGLATTNSFWIMLENLEVKIVRKIKRRDHCDYKRNDIESYLTLAKQLDAIVLTTEKDMVKIKEVCISDEILFIDVNLKFIEGESSFKEKLNQMIS